MRKVPLLVACCAFLLCTAATAAPPMGIANGGFETGVLDPWFQQGTPVTFTVDASAAHSGSYGVLGVAGPDWVGGLAAIVQNPFPLAPNTRYRASYWRKTEGDMWAGIWDLQHNIAESTLYEFDAAGNIIVGHQLGTVCPALPDWNYTSVEFVTAPNLHHGYIHFNCHLEGPGQKIFLDDFMVEVIPEPGSIVCLMAGCGFLGFFRGRTR